MELDESSIPEKAPGAKIFSIIPTRTESYGWLGRLCTSFTSTKEDNSPSVKDILEEMGKEEASDDIANIVYMANVLRQQVPHSYQSGIIWSFAATTMLILKLAGLLAEKACMKCKLSLKVGTIIAEDGSATILDTDQENNIEDYIMSFISGLTFQDVFTAVSILRKDDPFFFHVKKLVEVKVSNYCSHLRKLLQMSSSPLWMRLYVSNYPAILLRRRSEISKLFSYALFLDRSELARVLVGHLDGEWKANWRNTYVPKEPRVSIEHGMAIINTVFKLIQDTLERSEIERYLSEPEMRTLSGE